MEKFKKILYTVLYGAAGVWLFLTLMFFWLNTAFNWFATLNWGLISILVVCYVANKVEKIWIKGKK